MAEEESSQTEKEAPAEGGEKKKKKGMLLIIIAAVVVLLGGGAAAYFFLFSGGSQAPTAQGEATEAAGHETPAKTEAGSGHGAPASEGEKKPEAKAAEEGASHGEAANKSEPKKDKNEQSAAEIQFGATYPLKPFHLNLGNPLENRYLRLEVALEYKQGEAQQKELEARLPQLRDAVLSVASRKTREFLLGPDGKDQLRFEILNRINQYMEKKIESVFITDMLIE